MLALAAALALPPALARADGDPASDVLLLQDVFVSYEPISTQPSHELTRVVAAANKAGFRVRVALIATTNDLGTEFGFWNRPQEYAQFLNREISFNSVRPLLVVLPDGFGVDHVPAKASNSIDQIPILGATQDGLAAAAIVAVARMSAALGHPIPGAPLKVAAPRAAPHHHGGKSGGTGWAVLAIPGVLVILGLAALSLRLRERRAEQ